jgi:hypothetical protein
MNRINFEDYPRRRPLTKEEWAFVNDTAREFYHGSVDSYIAKHLREHVRPHAAGARPQLDAPYAMLRSFTARGASEAEDVWFMHRHRGTAVLRDGRRHTGHGGGHRRGLVCAL